MKKIISLISILMVTHSALAAVPPFTAPPGQSDLLPEEDRNWEMSDDMDKAIRLKGALLNMPEVNAYLQELVDSLYPELKGALRVKAIDDPIVNAFCMANGKIYVHLGMLARVNNEAQLTTVLAHEGAHFVHRHSYQSLQSAQTGSAFMTGATILFGGIGSLVSGLVGVSSIAGFARDMEREADRVGFLRLGRAGYDTREAYKVFEILAEVTKVEDKSPPYLFASHPRLQERIASYKELIEKDKEFKEPSRRSDERFNQVINPLKEVWLKRELGQARYNHVIQLLSQPEVSAAWPVHHQFYLGEAYRLRNEKDDADKALEAYLRATLTVPNYAPGYRELGSALYKKQDALALETLQKYLTLAPDAEDRLFVEQLIEKIK